MSVRHGIALALAVVLGLGTGVAFSAASRRPARAILAELDALKLPGGFLDEAATQKLLEVCRRRAELELELFRRWPGHARVPGALEERWAFLENTFHEHEPVLAETEEVLAQQPSRKLAGIARRARAWTSVHAEQVPAEECVSRIDAARPGAVDDDWTAAMLVELASNRTADRELQKRLCRRVLDAPKLAPESKSEAAAWLKLVELVGQPLGLAAAKGNPLLVYVRRESDWQPLEQGDLRAIEERHAASRLAVAQVLDDWDARFEVRKTPLFLLADAEGRLIGVSQSLAPLEAELSAARL